MDKRIFYNNYSTELSSQLAAGSSSMVVADVTGISSPAANEILLLTLVSPTDPTSYEIVRATALTGNTFTITRNQESSGDELWVVGTKVECRVTAGMLNELLRNVGSDNQTIFVGGTDAQATSTVARSVVIGANAVCNDDETVVIGYGAKHNGTSSSEYSVVIGPLAINDGTSNVVIGEEANSTGGANVNTQCVVIGTFSEASHDSVVAIGGYAKAHGAGSIAIGNDSDAEWTSAGAIVIGQNSRVYGKRGIVIGSRGVNQAESFGDDIVHIHANPAAQHRQYGRLFDNTASTGPKARDFQTLESWIMSPWVDLGAGVAWASAASYKDGDVVVPLTGGHAGKIYHLVVDPYNPVTKAQDADQVYAVTGTTTEPTWPTTAGGTVNAVDGTSLHKWVCIDLETTGFDIEIDPSVMFVIKSAGFICKTLAGTWTTVPVFDCGTDSNTTAYLSGQTLSSISGGSTKVAEFDVEEVHEGSTTPNYIRFHLATRGAGSGSIMYGRFFVRGVYIQRQDQAAA